MIHESFLVYKNFLYLKWASFLMLLSIILYVVHQPDVPANGGTWLGYALGSIAAFIIIILLWLGIRKRQFNSSFGTVQGWLSAHVYFGLALLVVATLHSGFQFDWNLHMLAYLLMLLVIISGSFGIYVYAIYPQRITNIRKDQDRQQMFEEIARLDDESLRVADQIGDEAREVISRSIASTHIGGSLWQQLKASEGKDGASVRAENRLIEIKETIASEQEFSNVVTEQGDKSTLFLVSEQLSKSRENDDSVAVRRLLELLRQKKQYASRLRQDVRMHALLQVWLFVHVPLSFALLAALIAHVIVVFFYW